ncbi:MAG: heavy metal response regulator transcription factor [Verrucomicrobiales bacterium]|nr:heavy metal response regulator transcription factor [Verrucomicrobiales bacterium]
MKILLIEDDPRVARFVLRGLKEEGFVVDHAADGDDGLHAAATGSYELVILDVLLPRRDGFEVLTRLRRSGSTTRVLMLTARDAVADRVKGLEGGADDYLVKPFAFAELLARIRALLRRPRTEEPVVLTAGDLQIDTRRQSVSRAGRPVPLTAKEYAVLVCLVRQAGEVLTRTRLAEQAWDENFDPLTNVIDVTIYHLREKVDRGFGQRLIHTVRGRGYVLRPDEPTANAAAGE